MKSELRFEGKNMRTGNLGTESSVPSFLTNQISQNKVLFALDDWDEIYEAYGRYYYAYPYRELNTYDRKLKDVTVRTAVLENDSLKAVFLPDFGGRLWSLTDKINKKELLYTNDVLRYSNLSVRNAWFSGGVEWNIGIIGHTAMSTETLHTAQAVAPTGEPVLRMYGYERIRGLEYQMDFWLDEKDVVLNCRMRIINTSKDVVPVYWWSNMAVPENENGRVVAPTEEAFTCDKKGENDEVYKTPIPMVRGIDVSKYNNIPYQVDYFFNIPRETPKYVANLDSEGYGLLHTSTDRLRGRKLFSWGTNVGSERWQQFLTDKAGRYLEIQAGIPQTQYGCMPLAPHSTWEWVEQYGPVQMDKECTQGPFDKLRECMTGCVLERMAKTDLDNLLGKTSDMARNKATVNCYGRSYGTLKDKVRKLEGDVSLSKHLDHGKLTGSLAAWGEFLDSGVFVTQDPKTAPDDFHCDEIFYKKLKATIGDACNVGNWYAHYQLGVLHLQHECYGEAKAAMEKSLALEENPWAYHGLALLALDSDSTEAAREAIVAGIKLASADLSYVKEGFRILLMLGAYSDVYALHSSLAREIKADTRIQYDYMLTLADNGKYGQAFEMLMADGGFVLDDQREGQDTLEELYVDLYYKINGVKPDSIPAQFDFHAGPPVEK